MLYEILYFNGAHARTGDKNLIALSSAINEDNINNFHQYWNPETKNYSTYIKINARLHSRFHRDFGLFSLLAFLGKKQILTNLIEQGIIFPDSDKMTIFLDAVVGGCLPVLELLFNALPKEDQPLMRLEIVKNSVLYCHVNILNEFLEDPMKKDFSYLTQLLELVLLGNTHTQACTEENDQVLMVLVTNFLNLNSLEQKNILLSKVFYYCIIHGLSETTRLLLPYFKNDRDIIVKALSDILHENQFATGNRNHSETISQLIDLDIEYEPALIRDILFMSCENAGIIAVRKMLKKYSFDQKTLETALSCFAIDKRYPGFNQSVISELKTALENFNVIPKPICFMPLPPLDIKISPIEVPKEEIAKTPTFEL